MYLAWADDSSPAIHSAAMRCQLLKSSFVDRQRRAEDMHCWHVKTTRAFACLMLSHKCAGPGERIASPCFDRFFAVRRSS
jgi:hypothetical protein